MLNFALCDDNITILTRLSKMLEDIFIKYDFKATVKFSTTSSNELISYLKENLIDVLILDINLKSDCSGLELAKIVRKTNKNMYLIFSTAHLEYALVAYKLKTFDYLPKPLTPERLEDTIFRIFDDINCLNSTSKFLKLGKSKIIVKEDEIEYIKKDGMKLIYHTGNKNYEVYSSFNQIEDNLPENFVRCHKSYIVNLNNVSNIEPNKNTVLFNSKESCNIGPKYKNNLMEVFKNGNFSKHLDSFNN